MDYPITPLNSMFSAVNSVLAFVCAFSALNAATILSDKKSLARIKAGYFLSIEKVVLSWKLIFAASAVFFLQYFATTLFLLGVYSIPTFYVLLGMYVMEAVFILLLAAGLVTNHLIIRKYSG